MNNKIAFAVLLAAFATTSQAEEYAISQGQCGAYLMALGTPVKKMKAFLARHPATEKSQAVATEFAAELVSSVQSGRKDRTTLLMMRATESCGRLGVNPGK